jgi:alanine dehydrogenase
LAAVIPFFTREALLEAVTPERAVAAVSDAFVHHARGEWTMPPKVYVPAYPAGDFRAMPALGGGYAMVKWISSFPGNLAGGLPTVTGLLLLSDATNGMLCAAFDAAAVTSLRTGAAAVLAAEALGRGDTAAVIGCGVNGLAAARTFAARGRAPLLWDVDHARARAAAAAVGGSVAGSREQALDADLVATVTPGKVVLYPEGSLRPGQHVSLMGADGPGKAEIAAAELERVRSFGADRERADPDRTPLGHGRMFFDGWEEGETEVTPRQGRGRLFCDDWEQASHGGELAQAVKSGLLGRGDVTELGQVLIGEANGRLSDRDITLFDSTGLAIQDLAIAILAFAHANELDLPTIPV